MKKVFKQFIECIIFLTAIQTNLVSILAIKCYKCDVADVTVVKADKSKYTIPSCAHFNRSSEIFIADCRYSTMCLETIATLYLSKGVQLKTVTRGCAQQKFKTFVFKNRQWIPEYTIEEVYTEGCMEMDDDNSAPSRKTMCHCRGDLCNFKKHKSQREKLH